MATLEWEPLNTSRLVAFTLTGAEPGTYLLDPGTGHTRTLTPGRSVVCPYPSDGAYMAHVLSPDDEVVASAQVTVRDRVPARFQVPEQEQDTIHLIYDGPAPTVLEVDWGDGDIERGWHTPGQPPRSQFTHPGAYAGTITDVCARRTERQSYLIAPPAKDPDLSVAMDLQDPTRQTVVVELTHTTGRGPIEVDWGDSTTIDLIAEPEPGSRLKHHYPSGAAGVYLLACYYASAPGNSTVKAVKIPWPR